MASPVVVPLPLGAGYWFRAILALRWPMLVQFGQNGSLL
jgi:hypothetical protein